MQWHLDETAVRVGGRWCYLWRGVDQFGQMIDFHRTGRRNAKTARAFLRQAQGTVPLYRPLAAVTDKARSYAKVVGEINERFGPDTAICHVDRKHRNNRIEAFRTIPKGQFKNFTIRVANKIDFVAKLFREAA